MLNIDDYRDVITYSDDPTQALSIDELLLLLAELIDDEQISEVVNKYVDDYCDSFKEDVKSFEQLESTKEFYLKKLKDVYAKADDRDYLDYGECLDDIQEIIVDIILNNK